MGQKRAAREVEMDSGVGCDSVLKYQRVVQATHDMRTESSPTRTEMDILLYHRLFLGIMIASSTVV